jgi:hypothetical protein
MIVRMGGIVEGKSRKRTLGWPKRGFLGTKQAEG